MIAPQTRSVGLGGTCKHNLGFSASPGPEVIVGDGWSLQWSDQSCHRYKANNRSVVVHGRNRDRLDGRCRDRLDGRCGDSLDGRVRDRLDGRGRGRLDGHGRGRGRLEGRGRDQS